MLRAFGFEQGESREEVKEEITPTRRRSSGARIASEPSGLDWRAFAEQGAATHAGNEPPRRWWRGVWRQSVPRKLTRRESMRLEWDAAALANERSIDEAPPRRLDLKNLKADLIPHLMEILAVVVSAWFSFAIAHFGPKVETQLSWTLVTVLASLYRPSGTEAGADLVEAVLVGALTGGSSRREPRVIPGLGWLTLVALLSGILWCLAVCLVKEFEIARGNGGRYGMIAFISTMSVSLFILMPAHKTSYGIIYNHVDNWNAMVRAGQVFRYLAATPTAAFLTRMTKISTGHASPTAGAASAMLLILLIQVIGDSVTRRYLLDVTAGVTIGAFVGMSDATTLPTARVIVIAVVAVGWRLLTVPFCRGFAGIEAFNAFLAVKSQYFLFSTGSDNPFERAGPENNV